MAEAEVEPEAEAGLGPARSVVPRQPASEISVALTHPGDRVDRMLEPLRTTDLDLAVDPEDPYERDVVLMDNPDKRIVWPLLRSRGRDCQVVYRIRGDMLRAYRELNTTSLKYHAVKTLLGKVDAAVSIEPVLARKFRRVTGVSPIGLATLAKRPSRWPGVIHTEETLRCVTLTNMNYLGKIQPLIDYAEPVNRVLLGVGGHWTIYGRGRYERYLRDHLDRYSTISVAGYTDEPAAALAESNLMLHFSAFDSLPNAILEGLASALPVVTNPYHVFLEYGDPLVVSPYHEVTSTLQTAVDPAWRAARAEAGLAHVRETHNPATVGQQYVRFFQELVDDDDR